MEEVKRQRRDVVLQPTMKTQEKRGAGGHMTAALENLRP